MTPGLPTSMTLSEMRAARERGESQTDGAAVRGMAERDIEPEEGEDSPDVTGLIRAAIAKRRAGRPAGSAAKEQVSIRYDKDILAAFRATGPGWQRRMNDALREGLGVHPASR